MFGRCSGDVQKMQRSVWSTDWALYPDKSKGWVNDIPQKRAYGTASMPAGTSFAAADASLATAIEL